MEQRSPFLIFSDIEDNKDDTCCCFVLPVSEGNDFRLSNPELTPIIAFEITNLAGDVISEKYTSYGDIQRNFGVIDLSNIDLSKLMAPKDCFRIKAGERISNPFQYIGCKTKDTHLFEFWDDEATKQRVRLRCTIENPQPKTDKSEYEDANGTVHSLSKKIRKEYAFTSDFYPEYVHDAISEMFIYPNLLVDDDPMFESGDYEINWEEKDENDNAIGTTKLSEQEISKFSNC